MKINILLHKYTNITLLNIQKVSWQQKQNIPQPGYQMVSHSELM